MEMELGEWKQFAFFEASERGSKELTVALPEGHPLAPKKVREPTVHTASPAPLPQLLEQHRCGAVKRSGRVMEAADAKRCVARAGSQTLAWTTRCPSSGNRA